MTDVTTRILEIVESWPVGMRRDFHWYLGRWQGRTAMGRADETTAPSKPYWLLFPPWLARKVNRGRHRRLITDTLLEDILVGQYCVFLAFRMQDDLYDGQIKRRSLIFVSDQLLLEAERIFLKHYRRHPGFWTPYHRCLEDTIRGIVVADELQKSVNSDPSVILREYARVSAIFKIGSLAVCMSGIRDADWPALAAACDNMAVVSQIIDDMQDLQEDLRRGRINYAAQVIIGRSSAPVPSMDKLPGLIAENMAYSDALMVLCNDMDRNLRSAARIMRSLGLRESKKYLETMRGSIAIMRDTLHAERVRFVFEGLVLNETGDAKT